MIETQETPIDDQIAIHALSVQLGDLFANLYASGDSSAQNVLDAYISMRQALPKGKDGRIGAWLAYEATQGRL